MSSDFISDEDHARARVATATIAASVRYALPTLVPMFIGALIAVVAWPLAVAGALALPSLPLTLLGLAVPVAALVWTGVGMSRLHAKRQVERATRTTGEQVAALREQHRQRQTTPPALFPRRWTAEWCAFTVPRAVLVSYALVQWLPQWQAFVVAVFTAGWPLVSRLLTVRSKRIERINNLLLADGEKPTPEV